METNYAKERLRENMSPVFPSNDIDCKDCIFRKEGIIGYKNAFCSAYPKGKPNGILFDNKKCEYKHAEENS